MPICLIGLLIGMHLFSSIKLIKSVMFVKTSRIARRCSGQGIYALKFYYKHQLANSEIIESTEITLLNLTGTSLALNWRGCEIHEHAYTMGKTFQI